MNPTIISVLFLCLVGAEARVAVVNTTAVSAGQAVVQLPQLNQLDAANANQAVIKASEVTAALRKAVLPESPADVDPATVGTAHASSNWQGWLKTKTRFSAWYKSLARAVRVAQAVPQMSTLLAAVNAAGVGGPLSDSSTAWTILAPTNDAFEDLLVNTLKMSTADLLDDTALLVKVLSYHVVPTPATSNDLVSGTAYPTALAGAFVTVTKLSSGAVRIQGTPACNTAKVTVANIRAGKSIIHVIDTVLLPP